MPDSVICLKKPELTPLSSITYRSSVNNAPLENDPGTVAAATMRSQPAIRAEHGIPQSVKDTLVCEEPLQININGKPFSVTMRTPGHDAELVKGLLLTEGIVDLNGLGMDVPRARHNGFTVAELSIPAIYLCANLHEKRSLIANASCGFCGKREITDLDLVQPRLTLRRRIDADLIPRLVTAMHTRQQGFAATGGCHAAAAFDIEGTHLAQYEDIGRHNAVDKVIGHLVTQHLLGKAAILQVSGRVSFEIVSKAAVAGLQFLCAVSAPSSLAVDLAAQAGITLIGFSREDRFTIYSHPEAVDFKDPDHAQ